MKSFILQWSNVIKFEESVKYISSKMKGVYLHFLRFDDYYRIVYVGSGLIKDEQVKYFRQYKRGEGFVIDLEKIEDDPYSYITNGKYNESLNARILYAGGTNADLKGKYLDELKNVAKHYSRGLYLSFSELDEDCEKAEAIIQKYLINRYKIDYYNGGNLVGLRNTFGLKQKMPYKVINNFYPAYHCWFQNLPSTIEDTNLPYIRRQTVS